MLDRAEPAVHHSGDVGDRLVALEVDEVTGHVLGRDEPVRRIVVHLAGRRTDDREPRRPLHRHERMRLVVEAEAAADPAATPEQRVVSLIKAANLRVHQRATSDASASGMGTTMTVAMLGDDGRVTIGHVGDSRAYRLRDDHLEQLTDDHSLVAELVRRGLVPSRERAQAEIESGRVTVGGAPATKASRLVESGEAVEVLGAPPRFVSRGGEKLEAALAKIHPRYARAIRLRVLEERPREDVAQMLEVTPSTFDVLLHRAVAALKKGLSREDEDE